MLAQTNSVVEHNNQQSVSSRRVHSLWQDICAVDDIVAGTGVAARINGKQLAIFHTAEGFHGLSNCDPFSGANVLSRGLLGDICGVLAVASPVYKQHFCLRSGQCLEEPEVKVAVYPVRVCEQGKRIQVQVSGE